jgi:O-antigen/teichoic acid export membrane protein
LITTANVLFQKTLSYHYATIALGLGSLISLVLVMLFPISSTVAITSLLIGVSVTAVTSLFFASRIEVFSVRFSVVKMKTMLTDAAPLTLTLLFNLVYFRIDSVILTLTRSTAEVGVYNLAYKFFEFPLLFPVLFMNSLFPLLLKQTKLTFNRTVKKAALILGGLGLCCTIAGLLFSPLLPLIRSDFASVVPLLQALSLAFPFFFLSNLVMWILITKKLNQQLVYIYGTAMLINIVCNIVFVPMYGPVAAAVITILGEGFVLLLGVLAIRKLLSYDQ